MRMNDGNVYGVGAPKVLQENAYMLLYVRNAQRPYQTRAANTLLAARAAAEEKRHAAEVHTEPRSLYTLNACVRAPSTFYICS